MKSLVSSLVALGIIGPSAVVSTGPLGMSIERPGAAPFIECGSGVPGKAGVVVVHLRDGAEAQRWSLLLVGSPLAPQGIEWAGRGTIRIEIDAPGGPWTCQATPPSPFHVRSTAKHLAGSTLRILAREPIRIEIQNAQGRVLASRTLDPAAHQTSTIGW
jgi:hypothetical protein